MHSMLWLGLQVAGHLNTPLPKGESLLDFFEGWFLRNDPDGWWHHHREMRGDIPGLQIEIHPAEMPLTIMQTGPDMFVIVARTIGAGPGYHEYLVELLDSCALELDLLLQWDSPDADPTGYRESRDVSLLREVMLEWLRALSAHVIEGIESGRQDCAVCFPGPAPMPADRIGARSPMGWWEPTFWKAVIRESQIEAYGREFFPWFESGRTAEYYRNRALSLMWGRIRWHLPDDEQEADLFAQAVQCVEKAHFLGARDLPLIETAELLDLLEAHEEAEEFREQFHIPSRPGRLGFYRHPQVMRLFNLWQVVLPGDIYVDTEDTGSVFVFWDEEHTARISAWPSEKSVPPELSADNMDFFPAPEPEALDRLTFIGEEMAGYLDLYQVQESREETYYVLQGYLYGPQREALLTFSFDHREDQEWAMRTVESLYPLPEEEMDLAESDDTYEEDTAESDDADDDDDDESPAD